jgi:hypothetical protein
MEEDLKKGGLPQSAILIQKMWQLLGDLDASCILGFEATIKLLIMISKTIPMSEEDVIMIFRACWRSCIEEKKEGSDK